MRKSTTYLHAVASLDGYIADQRDDVGPLHDWYFNGDHPLRHWWRWMPLVILGALIAGRRWSAQRSQALRETAR